MSQSNAPGTITWHDLTVPNADTVRDFYKAVVGWSTSDVDMGGYNDYCMHPTGSDPIAGVCHAKGINAAIPPVWLVYINVADIEASCRSVAELSGKVLLGPKSLGGGQFCIIQDPAGAICALFQPG